MKIIKWKEKLFCDDCGKLKENGCEVLINNIDYETVFLCDECLQELNRKIVEHLAEKNL